MFAMNRKAATNNHSVIRIFGYSVIPKVRQGFTLIELLVVIAILSVLIGILTVSVSGGTESARSAQCLANMKNLASACQTFGAENGRYPHAGSIEYMTIDESDGIAHVKSRYHEEPGWISWNSQQAYKNAPSSHQASSAWMLSMYSDDVEATTYCLTNGALWRYVSGNRETYVCPSHKKKMKKSPPHWSYLMNGYFGWDTSEGSEAESQHFDRIDYGHLEKADKVLLFSEVPFAGVGGWQPQGGGSGTDCDCVLQFDTGVSAKTGMKGVNKGQNGGNETIGFNHKNGKTTFAHVVFADGHTEKLQLPKGGISDSELKNLTAWLCMGVDISFNGKQYQKMEN